MQALKRTFNSLPTTCCIYIFHSNTRPDQFGWLSIINITKYVDVYNIIYYIGRSVRNLSIVFRQYVIIE